MTEIFGFDPKTFTDDELAKKSQELMKKISWASRYSTNMVGALQTLYILIDNERRERMMMENWKAMENYLGKTIETDPDQKDNTQEIQKVRKTIRKPFKPTMNPVIPTTTPIIPQQKTKDNDDE
jgi:hypothetical protein